MLTNNSYQNFEKLYTLQGHSDSISTVLITSDNQSVFSASRDSTIKLWSLKNRQEIYTLQGHLKAVTCIAISSNEKIIVSGSEDSTLKVWNLRNGQNIFTFTGHSKPVYAVAISPDGKTVASGSWDTTIRLWDLNTGRYINSLNGHKDTIKTLDFSPDGNILVSGGYGPDAIKFWDLNSCKEIRTLKANTMTGEISSSMSLIVTKDGKKVISADFMAIDVFDLATGKYLGVFKGDSSLFGFSGHSHNSNIYSLVISKDNSVLVSGSQDRNKHIAIWDVNTGQQLHKLVNESNNPVFTVAISSNKQTIISNNLNNIDVWGIR